MRIIHEATARLMDRLKNGDASVAGGEAKRKPVSARDLALVATRLEYEHSIYGPLRCLAEGLTRVSDHR